MSVVATDLALRAQEAKSQLDAHVREIVAWHFTPRLDAPSGWISPRSSLGIHD
jgi:hypothetical protein